MLHHLFTPVVVELIALGRPALPLVVALLSAPDADTRARAFLVIRRIVEANPHLRSWETLAAELGPYDPGAPAGEREAGARRWREWVKRGTGEGRGG